MSLHIATVFYADKVNCILHLVYKCGSTFLYWPSDHENVNIIEIVFTGIPCIAEQVS